MATTAPQQFKTSPIPPTELSSREEIRFLHPGYPAPNTLLSLPRVDRTPTGTFGVHHRTALLACQIIANNAFSGYLTLDQAGQQRVNAQLDSILIERIYYFIVGAGPDRYPVVPSFQDWEFPHDHIPDSWPRIVSTGGVHRCGITNFSLPLENAHLVPKEETDWYHRNSMERYSHGVVRDIDNPANRLPLKVDMYKIFDARGFVIIPKIAEAQTSHQYVTHILSGLVAEFWPTHHNIFVQNLHKDSLPYLFARFAWAVILYAKDFVVVGTRRVVQLHTTTDDDGVENREYKTEFLTAKKLMKTYGGGGSKAAAPKGKRPRTASAADDDSVESSDEDESMDDVWDVMGDVWDVVDDEGGPKRRKQQRSSEETAADTKPSLPPDVEAGLKEALQRGMAEQQASQEARGDSDEVEASLKEALHGSMAEQQVSQEAQEDSREVEMALRLK